MKFLREHNGSDDDHTLPIGSIQMSMEHSPDQPSIVELSFDFREPHRSLHVLDFGSSFSLPFEDQADGETTMELFSKFFDILNK
jgi:hypothetical protein